MSAMDRDPPPAALEPGAAEHIAARWREASARVAAACLAAGRAPADVVVVAVSKRHPPAAIAAAVAAGARDFGESYAQELGAKQAACAADPALAVARWHFIGRLQRNKAKQVAGRVVLVHAVDSAELAEELGRRAGGATQPVLLAVNIEGEATKGGVTIAGAPAAAAAIAAAPGVRLDGLMTIPPAAADPEASRPAFLALRDLRVRLEQLLGARLPVLSMGMSGDFEVAIACGATHVRIGTAIFGERR
jgi:hypothetical protein